MPNLSDFSYHLPPERIAHSPIEPADHCRLLVLNRHTKRISHHHFYDLPTLLEPGDVIVRNNSRVIPARLMGHKATGGKVEVFLTSQVSSNTRSQTWKCLTKPGIKPGQTIIFPGQMTAKCLTAVAKMRQLRFAASPAQFWSWLDTEGQMPLPPYINSPDSEQTRRLKYQTYFADQAGSVAAPTAGLHFTPELDAALTERGIDIVNVTLHVGLGTFLPVTDRHLATGRLHQEWFSVSLEASQLLDFAVQDQRRIIAIGTTSARVLETLFAPSEPHFSPAAKTTSLFIKPPYQFRAIDGLVTNFHLPESSLLMLVSAFISAPNTNHTFSTFAKTAAGAAYAQAITKHYRFFSFGDAMLII